MGMYRDWLDLRSQEQGLGLNSGPSFWTLNSGCCHHHAVPAPYEGCLSLTQV